MNCKEFIKMVMHLFQWISNSCNTGMRALPDIYAQLPKGIHIRQSPNARVTANT